MNWPPKRPQKHEHGTENGVWLHNAYLARIVACFVLYSFLVFMIGYFWGKYSLSYDTMQEIERTANKDSALAASCALQNANRLSCPSQEEVAQLAMVELTPPHPVQSSSISDTQVEDDKNKVPTHYYALLAGFTKEVSAQKFADKLRQSGINVEIRKRLSKSAQGNSRAWYQIATMPFTNREELAKLVEQVRRQEHLTDDVRILAC